MRFLIMTVLTLSPETVLVETPIEWRESASVFGSRIMQVHGPNAPQMSATTLLTVAEADVTLRDEPVSDDDVLAWGRSLPRHPGVQGMIDLDI